MLSSLCTSYKMYGDRSSRRFLSQGFVFWRGKGGSLLHVRVLLLLCRFGAAYMHVRTCLRGPWDDSVLCFSLIGGTFCRIKFLPREWDKRIKEELIHAWMEARPTLCG